MKQHPGKPLLNLCSNAAKKLNIPGTFSNLSKEGVLAEGVVVNDKGE